MKIETIGLNSYVVRSTEPLTAPVDGELVMFSGDLGKYFSLNRFASAIWHNIETPTKVSSICAQLEEVYEVTSERCQHDVLMFLHDIQRRGLLFVVDERDNSLIKSGQMP